MALIGPISGSSGLSSVIGITGSLDITYDGETSEQADGYIQMTAVTAPGTPATDRGRLYVALNSGTPTLYFKDDEGTATSCIQGGGGSGTITALNNQTANRLVTIGSTTTELDGESGLTYDGTDLTIAGSIAGCNRTLSTSGLSSAGDGQGDVIYLASTSVTAGKIYWYDGTNWNEADATGPASQPIKLLAVALGTGTASTVGMLLRGLVVLSQDPLLSDTSEVLYISETAGVATADASTLNTTGNIVRVIGYSLHVSSGLIYFNPDQTWVVIA